jgi:6-phosphofructokinase 1
MANKSTGIGILTGGGDVPGLNSVIKSVTYGAGALGRQVVGIRRGWKGLTHLDPADPTNPAYFVELNRDNTRKIDRTGGTVLHTSRTNPRRMAEAKLPKLLSKDQIKKLPFDGKVYDLTSVVIENLERLGVGFLVAIGGDDTLSFAAALSAAGFPVVGVPKTMDNDVRGTEYCIGFSTAVTRARDAIDRQRTIMGSHERIGVFRIFGRDAGFTALYTAYVTGGRCLIPEYPFNLERAIDLLMEDKRNNSSAYSLVVMSEGAMWEHGKIDEVGEADAYGHKKKVNVGEAFAREIEKSTGGETMPSDLTYELRSGGPDVIDQVAATTFANIALSLIAEGVSGRMTAVQKGCYTHTILPATSVGPRKVDIASLYDTQRYRPNFSSKIGMPLLFSGDA